MQIDVNSGIIKADHLLRVGHINAICGRNNSGKSTLLRAIQSKEIDVAMRIAEIPTDTLRQMVDPSVVGQFVGNRAGSVSSIFGFLRSNDCTSKYIRANNNAELRNAVIEVHPSNANSVQFYPETLIDNLRGALPLSPTPRKIVPAKRMLRDAVPPGLDPSSLDGSGVLEHLFRLQTHRTDRSGMAKFTRLGDVFELVTNGYRFEIDHSAGHLFLHFRLGEGTLIPAKDCGLGLQDVLIMLYASVVDDVEWLLIEEPENHLHPQMQRELLRFFKGVEDKTFFLATHSSVLLDQTYVDTVYQCAYDGEIIRVSDATSKAALLSDLGYSATDNLVADTILAVEGKHDKAAVEEIASKLVNRSDKIVRVWLLGGDIMGEQDFEAISSAFDVRVLIDREKNKGSRQIRERVESECARLKIPCMVLQRYAMENYYSPEAYQVIFPTELVAPPEIRPDEKVEKSLGFDPKRQTRSLARETSLEHLEGTDLLQFVRDAYS